ncbi:glycosyltransferase [Acidomonas methanolica]|uniref:glycosyltransferase n=1 Tax=Acidomonas methanolica TaxID=437 RepID=UPI00211A66AB|nr:glycosyltransferase family 4 protein [Acidomonas methanolica]
MSPILDAPGIAGVPSGPPVMAGPDIAARWALPDASWLRTRYADVLRAAGFAGDGGDNGGDDAALAAFWRETGYEQGLVPSPLFAEDWYLDRNADVRMGVTTGIFASGFMHYCESGFLVRDPHWLFSERGYFDFNRDLTIRTVRAAGYANGYDHFLARGDEEERIAHPFYDPAIFRQSCEARRLSRAGRFGGFALFLEEPAARTLRTSWYFDPDWYAATYPAAVEAVRAGRYTCLLHHYLTNPDPTAYAPNAFFSEADYLAAAPDVAAVIREGVFRNGYDHFLRFGAREGRRPIAGFDLGEYAARPDVRDALRLGRFRDAFAHWVAHALTPESTPQLLSTTVSASVVSPAQCELLLIERARIMVPILARTPLDLRCSGTPDLTVIVAGRSFHHLLTALVSLQGARPESLDVIVLDTVCSPETATLDRLVTGIRILPAKESAQMGSALRRALERAQAAHCLLLPMGARLVEGALAAGLTRVRASGAGMVTGQGVGEDGTVREAGVTILRDGSSQGFGSGVAPFADLVAHARRCDAGCDAALICETEALRRAADIAPKVGLTDLPLIAALLLAESGKEVWYEPCFLSRVVSFGADLSSPGASRPGVAPERFHATLRHKPVAATSTWPGRRSPGGNVLFLCLAVPDPRDGGLALRDLAILDEMSKAGLDVTVFSLDAAPEPPLHWRPGLEERLERVAGVALDGFLQARPNGYDLVWISGCAAGRRALPALLANERLHPATAAVLDLGWLDAEEMRRRRLTGGVADEALFRRELSAELAAAWLARVVVTLQPHDAALLAGLGFRDLPRLGHRIAVPETAPDFGARAGLVHTLPIRAPGDAAHDGLDSFVHSILPLLDRSLPAEADLLIAGPVDAAVDLFPLTLLPRMAPLRQADDPDSLYRTGRVMIAPSRVAAGLPYEVMRAAAFGLPAVIGPDLAQQLEWRDGEECLVAALHETARFASAVERLYSDETLWRHVSRTARDAVRRMADPARFAADLDAILRQARDA